MTVEFQPEPLTAKLAAEIEALAIAHGREFTYHREIKGDVRIKWSAYFTLADHDRLGLMTAREAGRLVGYVVFRVEESPHYAGILTCQDDTFYLAPEYRGSRIGYEFLKAADAAMAKTGAHVLAFVNKAKADYASIWERLGYEREEIRYTRINRSA